MFVNSTLQQSGAQVADPLVWAYNVTCIKDSTGFCLADLYNGTKGACSDCPLKYGAAMLGSDYGRVRVQPNAFSSLLSFCSVPASSYPYSYSSTSATPTSTSVASATTSIPTCTGTPYIVTASDTCQSISKAKSIATDRLIAENGIDYNCSSLATGNTLCLGKTCSLLTVTTNLTCDDITSNQNFSSVQLVSWNPTIHASCDNLDSMVGRSICVSPPGTSSFVVPSMSITTATLSSIFSGPWTTGTPDMNPPNMTASWYNTQTTFPPGTTVTYTANATIESLEAERTVYCPITPQNYSDGFTEDDLPDACGDLIAPYCWPDLNAPVPTSTRFPAVCTPTASD